ncbi:MAG TPA: histidine kinase [Prolixibacteraceae bacterium]|nr:histidine kinase [Prolixibacteraceae bacterium]
MKNVCKLLVLLALLVTIQPVAAKKAEARFKPGDWFECEMEFVDNVPVFHNHWANNDSVALAQQYLVAKFRFKENSTDSSEVWSFEMVRYRIMHGSFPNFSIKNKSVALCFDSWYPNYYMEEYGNDGIIDNDELNNKSRIIRGTVRLQQNHHMEIQFADSAISLSFNATSIFPINFDGDYGSTSVSSLVSFYKTLEQFFAMVFGCRNLKPDHKILYNQTTVDQVQYSGQDSASFSIEKRKFGNSYTTYFLHNGLAYAFKDKYNQKVIAITKASFELPNKAVLSIIDKRNKKEEPKKYFDNISIDFGNAAHVISHKIKEENNITKYNFELKCGVEMIIRNNYLPKQSIFVEPGDTIQVTVQDDKSNPITVTGLENYIEYQKALNATAGEIKISTLSPECKAYLILKSKINATYSKLRERFFLKSPDMQEYHRAMTDFYYLKSFHYKTLFELENALTVVSQGNYWQKEQILALGAPFYTNFKYKYYSALSNFSQFSLYALLYEILYNSININLETYYDEFFINCGDTLMTNKICAKLNGVKSVQAGMELPFTKMLTEHEQEVDILPKKGKFGLLFLYVMPNHVQSIKKTLSGELPENVQFVTYQISREPTIKSDKRLPETALSKADSLDLFGHPSKTSEMDNLLYSSLEGILILYDDKGQIWYNSSYHYQSEGGNAKYITGIQNAIQQANNKPVSKSKNILLIILLSVIGSVSITLLFYRIRIARLKKKNAREKLIQELKLKSVQSQLNPHFLFNALNSIQVLVKSGDTKQADNYLVGFSELLRNVLQNADKRLVPLSEELKMVNRYCELEKLRLDFDCELTTHVQTNLDLIEVPYMLLQPIIENAIKHGVAKANDRGKLKVEIAETNSVLHIGVTDNGPGFDGVPLEVLKEKGRGLKLSLEKLQSIYGNEAEFVFLAANPGTTVSIKLKIG